MFLVQTTKHLPKKLPWAILFALLNVKRPASDRGYCLPTDSDDPTRPTRDVWRSDHQCAAQVRLHLAHGHPEGRTDIPKQESSRLLREDDRVTTMVVMGVSLVVLR